MGKAADTLDGLCGALPSLMGEVLGEVRSGCHQSMVTSGKGWGEGPPRREHGLGFQEALSRRRHGRGRRPFLPVIVPEEHGGGMQGPDGRALVLPDQRGP